MFYCLDVSPPKREASLEKFSYAAYEVAKRISLLIFFSLIYRRNFSTAQVS